MRTRFLPLALFLLTLKAFSQDVWEPQAANLLPSNYSVMNVSIVNDQVAWAVALDYNQWTGPVPPTHLLKILRTTNGGATWSVDDLTEAPGRVTYGIYALNENTALLGTDNFSNAAGLFYTSNGGGTWTQVLDGVAGGGRPLFFNDQEGVAVLPGYAIARTNDGGVTWSPLSPNVDYPPFLAGEDHLNTPTNWDIVGDTLWIGSTKGRVYRSIDKGQNWTVHQATSANNAFVSSAFIDSQNGLAMVGDFNNPPLKLIKTEDGGETWVEIGNPQNLTELLAIPCTRSVLGISYYDNVTAWSKDFGASWAQLDTALAVFGPSFLSPETGWITNGGATGPNPAIYKWSGAPLDTRTYVNQNASGNNDGSSWADAYTDLKVALDSAEAGDEIWVAEGTYLPAAPGGSQTSTFLMDKNLKLYGGFAGSECNLSERDILAHPTILSGDLNGDDVAGNFVTNRSDNTRTVLTIGTSINNDTEIDGFTVRGGHSDGSSNPSSNGGGIRSQGTPILRNCIFTHNFCYDLGGAISFGSANTGTSKVENCDFIKNKGNMGGAIDIRFSDVSISNCLFWANESKNEGAAALEENGGAIFTQNSNCAIKNCSFLENENISGGGGLFFWTDNVGDGFSLEVDSCHFENNAANGGAAIYVNISGKNSDVAITNSQFIENEVKAWFGTVTVYLSNVNTGSNVSIDNCLFEGNTSALGSAAMDVGSFGNAALSNYSITNCTFIDNTAEVWAGGLSVFGDFNSKTNFLLEKCRFEGNKASTRGGALWVITSSDEFKANINHCEFVNNESPSGAAIAVFEAELGTYAIPQGAELNIDNSLFVGNISDDAVIALDSFPGAKLLNCTIANNASGGIQIADQSALTLQNTILHNPGFIEYSAASSDVTITSHGGNLIGDLSLTGQLIPGDKQGLDPLFEGGGDYHLTDGSPCVGAGNPDGVTATEDIGGAPRVQGGRVDMGAYESPFVSSTKEKLAGEVAVSPNPVGSFLNIQLPETGTGMLDVQVFDAQAKLLRNERLGIGQPLDVQALAPGMYSLRVVVGERVFAGKFVKQ